MLALALSLYLTPIVRKGALKYDIVDRPDGKLKNHSQPIAYMGGLSIYLAFLLTLALTFELSREVLGILLSGTIVVVLGIIDDFKVLPPRVKFIGQAIAAFVLIKSGIYIKLFFFPEVVCLCLSFLWLMAITNAFNIIDVMDGLSSGIGFITSVILFVVAILNARFMIAILTISLAGALLGFLRYNFTPARIYLGDTGSMFIGLMISSLAMIGTYTQNNMFGCIAPIVVLGIPLFDTIFVMYIRWRRGIPIISGSPDHFALRLRKWRLSTRQTIFISYGISLLLGVFGILIMLTSNNIISLGILVFILLSGIFLGFLLKRIDMTL
jgi:UDP-GlcNAc:undecaprenyl-phosphate GlcNAc-1-phosphate transferase